MDALCNWGCSFVCNAVQPTTHMWFVVVSGLACVGVCSTAVAAAVVSWRGPVRFQVCCVCACVIHSPGVVVLVAVELVNLRVIDRMQLIEGCMGSERGTWFPWRL
jgi:hypothetical protein